MKLINLKTLFIAILIGAALYLGATLALFGVLVYGILRILIKPNKRESFVVALICLAIIPVLLFFEYTNLAEQIAINAYFFLLIGCLANITEQLQTP